MVELCELVSNPDNLPLVNDESFKRDILKRDAEGAEGIKNMMVSFFFFMVILMTSVGFFLITRTNRRVQINLDVLYTIHNDSVVDYRKENSMKTKSGMYFQTS